MKNLRITLFAMIVLLLVLAGCKPKTTVPAEPPMPLAAAKTNTPIPVPTSTPLPKAGPYINPYTNPGQGLLIFDISIHSLFDGWAIGRADYEDYDHVFITAENLCEYYPDHESCGS